MLELKPCPFCGDEARIVGEDTLCYVACAGAECFCALGEIWDRDAMPEHHFHSHAEAEAAWNKRKAIK